MMYFDTMDQMIEKVSRAWFGIDDVEDIVWNLSWNDDNTRSAARIRARDEALEKTAEIQDLLVKLELELRSIKEQKKLPGNRRLVKL